MTRPLLTEATLHASFLIDAWDAVPERGAPNAVYVREPADETLLDERLRVHADLHGSRIDNSRDRARLEKVYGELSRTDLAMVRMYGLPALSAHRETPYRQVGATFNDPKVRHLVQTEWPAGGQILVFLDELLGKDWLEPHEADIINGHSAVLPHARGMHALEQVAAAGDRARFLRAVGGTVHYIDGGVDTGPVIYAERLPRPLAFESLWACKAASFKLTFDLLVRLCERLGEADAGTPAGAVQAPPAEPAFRRRTFDEETARRAAAQFLEWRAEENLDQVP
ncbi:formyltransferase family protein [Actinomadura sp. ATCC 39365]|uniref:formyltransferase family protein n=1 Tax=Nonomuraea sp. NPDC005692 TaxID=3157168 RepID=UPI0033D68A46